MSSEATALAVFLPASVASHAVTRWLIACNAGTGEYGDFFYFSAVIGTSGQTADVSFVSKPMRRIGSLHCILAYLFNTTVGTTACVARQ